jgi:putative hydrolase of the HAD superfamily
VPQISAIFWDVGGVLLTNAWDHEQRKKVLVQFNLDEEEFQDRHEMLVSSLERGKITLDQYLDRSVFYRERSFTRDQFKEAMYSLSQPDSAILEIARRLAACGKYFMSTINNESKELNAYRIETFGLREIFDLFVSSCFVGLRKPEEGIYQLTLGLTQRLPEECCFIDDRPLNVDAARHLGMHAIEMQGAEQLREELQKVHVQEA